MQQLRQRTIKNTPMDASQVRSNCGLSLNRDESLSVIDLKTRLNNPDVNQVQHAERSIKSFVYVLSIEGLPLMPCSHAKSKRMVKKGAAKVVKLYALRVLNR